MANNNKNNTREFTVIASFILGWVITFVGFFMPPIGEVSNSVIIIFGQAMTYSAVGVGLADYINAEVIKHIPTGGKS